MSFSRCFRKKRLGVLPQCRTGAASTLSPFVLGFGISDYSCIAKGFEDLSAVVTCIAGPRRGSFISDSGVGV